MKNYLKKALQESGLKTFKAWSEVLGKNPKNFFREFKTKFEQLNFYLKPVGLEIKILKIKSKVEVK